MRMLLIFSILALGVLAYLAMIGRVARLREEFQDALRRAQQGRKSSLPSEDMVKCETCGTYAPASQQRDCGTPGCPHAGKPRA